MWLGLIAGWILGSALLYSYLIATAGEPQRPECMDCRRPDCAGCRILSESSDELKTKWAA